MPGRCILHIGAHKTGSSAFQSWLVKNAESLSRCGIAIPLHLIGSRGNAARLSKAIAALPAIRSVEQKDLARDFRRFLAAARDRTILISAEHFEDSLAAGRFAAVARCLHQAGIHDLVAVLILRNQADLLNSAFVQEVKAFLPVGSFPHFRDAALKLPSTLDWDRQLDRLQAAGFEARIGVYDGANPAEPIAASIFRLAGLQAQVPAALSFATPLANPSIGEIGALACHALAPLVAGTPGPLKDVAIRVIKDAAAAASARMADRPFNGFDAASLAALEARFAETNRKIAEHLTPDEAAPDAPAGPRPRQKPAKRG